MVREGFLTRTSGGLECPENLSGGGRYCIDLAIATNMLVEPIRKAVDAGIVVDVKKAWGRKGVFIKLDRPFAVEFVFGLNGRDVIVQRVRLDDVESV